MAIENFNVILCKNYEVAKKLNPEVTVEAEWGKFALEGSIYGLNHHGDFSYNPAPCNWDIEPLERGTIVCSHIDLDTIGGVLAVMGEKPEDNDFWKAAEYIDVNGPQHIYELPQKIQNQLNAIDAWENWKGEKRREEGITSSQDDYTNIKDIVMEWKEALEVVCNEQHPRHMEFLNYGYEQAQELNNKINAQLFLDDGNIRAFITDGVFCAGGYYSTIFKKSEIATITYNTKHHSVTLGFFDSGEKWSAKDIMQDLFGNEAGGHTGIAGTPRDLEMSLTDFLLVLKIMENKIRESGLYDKEDADIALTSLAFGMDNNLDLILQQLKYENSNENIVNSFSNFLEELSTATNYEIQLVEDENSNRNNNIIGISFSDKDKYSFINEYSENDKQMIDELIKTINTPTIQEEFLEI